MGCCAATEARPPADPLPSRDTAAPSAEAPEAAGGSQAPAPVAAPPPCGEDAAARVHASPTSSGRGGPSEGVPRGGVRGSWQSCMNTARADPLSTAVSVVESAGSSVSERSSPGTHRAPLSVGDLYACIEREAYVQAFEGFSSKTGEVAETDVDYVLSVLGMAVLHGLGGPSWRADDAHDIKKGLADSAATWLRGRIDSNATPNACALALAEYHEAGGRATEACVWRQYAARHHPLGRFKHAAHSVHAAQTLNDPTAARALPTHAADLASLAEGSSLVAARAAKVVWRVYYKGAGRVARDLEKTAQLLGKIIANEANDTSRAAYTKKLEKVEAARDADTAAEPVHGLHRAKSWSMRPRRQRETPLTEDLAASWTAQRPLRRRKSCAVLSPSAPPREPLQRTSSLRARLAMPTVDLLDMTLTDLDESFARTPRGGRLSPRQPDRIERRGSAIAKLLRDPSVTAVCPTTNT